MKQLQPALLVLAEGSVFRGVSIGAPGQTVGEVVFNTAMSGYQEILTDPSYHQQIVSLTYPHIGNVGVNPEDTESGRVQIAGLVVREVPRAPSSWRSRLDFRDYLKQEGLVGIAEVDTRRLTRLLRDKGAQNGCIITDATPEAGARALAAAKAFPGLVGADLAQVVSTPRRIDWRRGTWELATNAERPPAPRRFKVVAYDYGIKANILRLLTDRGCEVTVVPAQTTVDDVLALRPDGVFISNGPGDPGAATYAIEAVRGFVAHKLPYFGICLGHQLLALAIGGQTVKLKFGHHGANHPVQDLETGRVYISSQNHGFGVDEKTLPANAHVTHRSLFDGTNQGFRLTDAPAFSFQGHPEASPGPHDVLHLFDRFVDAMAANAKEAR
ncbi:MAG: carbamoyl-phosphate synthase small subunit [Nevskiaceae bacterium]|nr:MAG: carbamoyl-phosphate synthase small subunit [Nevskiaceae bacterium]TBR74147.1 MAG: carbamoyl-phosphate synthase small subunit [Nevskiaceae bacterium]